MSDACSYGTRAVAELLERFGLEKRWCFLDSAGRYHGLGERRVRELFAGADLFLDMGTHGAWAEEAERAALRVLVSGEAGFTQIKLEQALAAGEPTVEYDRYYSIGQNIGTPRSSAPSGGREWAHVYDPVDVERLPFLPAPPDAAYTTVMSWRAHEPIAWNGRVYGQKDVELAKFVTLPELAPAPVEVAIAGDDAPREELRARGWRVRDAHAVSISYDAWLDYLVSSRGEFSVAKNVFVDTWSGWFSDRSAAYLACGRPVVLQDTGFSEHLPCGEGLFAVRDVEGAAAALETIESDWQFHSGAARELARVHLDTRVVLSRFLGELGIP
jgi:hypothetical protein